MLPTNPLAVSPDWLTKALRESGAIDDVEVITVEARLLGETQAFFSRLAHLTVGYSKPVAAPTTMVIKMTSPVEGIPDNTREYRFYRDMAIGVDLPVPLCYHSQIDADDGRVVLLLEDLTHLRRVDFVAGADPRAIRSAMEGLASLHATFWGQPIPGTTTQHSLPTDTPFVALWERYLEQTRATDSLDYLPTQVHALGDLLATNPDIVGHELQGHPPTLTHNDAQTDNILFGATPHDIPATFIDWQFVGTGHGTTDVGYLLISSTQPETRRQTEHEALRTYQAALSLAGVEPPSLDDLHDGYRLSAFAKLAMTVVATVTADNTGPAKQAWRRADLTRLAAFIEDHPLPGF